MASIYNNRTLDASKDEIRVISILPETENGTLQCRMKTVSLQDWVDTDPIFGVEHKREDNPRKDLDSWDRKWSRNQKLSSNNLLEQIPKFPEITASRFKWGDFAAPSYTWGDPSHPETIEVNGIDIQVTRNLGSALLTFRKASMFGSDFMLWIDALCINQKNAREVQSQVGKMREIYTLCWSVTGFLGPEEDESWKAIDLLDKLANCYGDPEKSMLLREDLLEKPDLLNTGAGLP